MLIGLDIGTSACKAVAIDADGTVRARGPAPPGPGAPPPGWAEQDPADWERAAERTLAAVVAAIGRDAAVRGIGLSGQMHGLVALGADDRVLRPAILWCDNRTEAECAEVTAAVGGPEALLALTGNRMLPGFTGGKIAWMRRHEPALHERMRRFLLPKDAIRLRLTGEHATDVSDASGTGLFDVGARRWSAPMLGAVGLRPDQVPRAVESHERTGTLRPDIAASAGLPPGVPVFGGGGDSVIQTTSMGVIDGGMAGITIGTAALVGASADRCPANGGARLQVSCGNAPGLWHVMGCTLNGGGALSWLRDALLPVLPPGADAPGFAELVALADAVPPGANGLAFLPFLLGERCPHVAPDARAAFVGLTQGHDLGQVARALLEGVLLNLRAILDLMAEAGLAFRRVRASGGATASPVWMGLLADVLGREVATVAGSEEGGAYGAALLAGVGAGAWGSLAEALGAVHETGRFTPRADAARCYDRLYPVHAALHGRLAETHRAFAVACA